MTNAHVAASTYIQQIRNRNRQSPLKQIRLHISLGLVHHCYWDVTIFVHVCVFVYSLSVFDRAYVYMPRQVGGADEQGDVNYGSF